MKKKPVIMATCCLAGSLLVATPVYAAPTAGVTDAVSVEQQSESGTSVAGVSLALAKCISNNTVEQDSSVENVTSDDKKVAASEKKAAASEKKASKYDDMAVAQVDDYINIRSKADGDSEVVGKLYGDSVATVVKKVGKWYKIKSGSVTGYVKGEYVVVGDEDLTKSVSKQVATVNTTTLNVRDNASEDAGVVTLASDGQKLKVTSLKKADKGWVKVKANGKSGYVSSDYVDVTREYTYAVSKEEEEAKAAAKKAAKEAAATVQETEAAQQETEAEVDIPAAPAQTVQTAPANTSVTTNDTTNSQATTNQAAQPAPAAEPAQGTSSAQSATEDASAAQGASSAQSTTEDASAAQGASSAQGTTEDASAAQGASSAQGATEDASAAQGAAATQTVQDTSQGQAVADFACQFIGNPYVWGGTSLTNGADCSGFVMSVYANFGVSLPHSSYAMEGCGRAVSVSEMQPGDIICYGPHVAIYIGNNTVVHASSAETGIKLTSPANYRSIVTVRRIF